MKTVVKSNLREGARIVAGPVAVAWAWGHFPAERRLEAALGARAHIGVDSKEVVVHSLATAAASLADKHMLPDLLHGGEKNVRAKGEHPFRILKRVFGFTKVRLEEEP